jgi:hypothetical protein
LGQIKIIEKLIKDEYEKEYEELWLFILIQNLLKYG